MGRNPRPAAEPGQPESDRLEGYPHPRETHHLFGHQVAEALACEALHSGHMHHGWLLAGPEGIGKATFAYRFAKAVLASAEERAASDLEGSRALDLVPDSRTAALVGSNTHPDLLVMRRPYDPKTKAFRTLIPVDSIRQTHSFFGTTAGQDGWRVAIVDAADDMAPPAANALLKILEEPPRKALFLIVTHNPGRLLPTIRSRCRRLDFRSLSDQDLRLALAELGVAPDPDVLSHAEGSVRRALQLSGKEGAPLRSLIGVLGRLRNPDIGEIHALAETLSRPGNTVAFQLALDLIRAFIAQQTRSRAAAGASPAALARWSEVWDKLARLRSETETFNLDRKQMLLLVFFSLISVAQASSAAPAPAAQA